MTRQWCRAAFVASGCVVSALAQHATTARGPEANLLRSEHAAVVEHEDIGGGLTLDVTVGVRRLLLDIHPTVIRAHGATLIEDGIEGRRELDWPEPGTFAGVVRGIPGSIVAASRVRGAWRIIAAQGGDEPEGTIFVQSWADLGEHDAPGYAAYTGADLAPGDWSCGAGVAFVLPRTNRAGYTGRVACNTLAQIAFDADYSFYQANGLSVPNTIADIESVLNANNIIYARDVNIIHQITTVIVRTNQATDPYAGIGTIEGLLGALAQEWEQNQTGVTRDIAHLMVAERFSGGVIGVAYVGAVCTYGYGWSRSRFTTNLAYRVGLTAHELGHNWGAGHCDGDSDCFIMCGGIGGCSNNVTRFGSRSIRDIRAFVPTRTCLEAVDGFPTPLPPRPQNDEAATTVGTPVRIDVLANDFDGNCEPLILLSFPSRATCGHGTVSRSVGTGPGGRDELLYTPDPGYVGDDCIDYSVRDPGGFAVTARATVRVLALRTPENPAFTWPGLDATYYHTYPMELADLRLTTPYATGVVPTINFPSSTDPFAGSGRRTSIGAVFTGTLNLTAAGTYNFFTESDDGSALYVNDHLVVANDGPQGMTERGGDIALAAGPVSIRIEYFQGGGPGGLIARIQGPGLSKQVIPPTMWAVPGVSAAYYNLGADLNDLPDFSVLAPASRGVVAHLNQATVDPFLFGSVRREHVAATFTGYFAAPADGLYRFYSTSDDASVVYVGDALVVNNRGAHGMIERSGFAGLRAGLHAFKVEYWQGGGGAGLIVEVEGPGLTRGPITPGALFHVPAGVTDCNNDGVNDADQVTESLDLGDMIAGGDGRGEAIIGAGLNMATGAAVPASAFGTTGGSGIGLYSPLDGGGGRANLRRVKAVMVPRGPTPIAPGISVNFATADGNWWDAIRNAGTVWESGGAPPIRLADRPLIPRTGLGMHTDAGVTFDLSEVRALEGGRRVLMVSGVAGFTMNSCFSADIHAEFMVLVDGVVRFRRLCSPRATAAAAFEVPIAEADRYLTFMALNADGGNCDHFAVADARLVVSSELDADSDGLLDECACPADFNRDGGVDGADVEAFYRAWEASDPSADVNRDGGIDGGDVETFFSAWELGGC